VEAKQLASKLLGIPAKDEQLSSAVWMVDSFEGRNTDVHYRLINYPHSNHIDTTSVALSVGSDEFHGSMSNASIQISKNHVTSNVFPQAALDEVGDTICWR
jgi:hypothetical protein